MDSWYLYEVVTFVISYRRRGIFRGRALLQKRTSVLDASPTMLGADLEVVCLRTPAPTIKEASLYITLFTSQPRVEIPVKKFLEL